MNTVTRPLIVSVFVALAAMSSGSSAQQPARGFDGFFADKTMRVDYFHSGGVGQEVVALERVVSDGPWPGSRTKLVDDTNRRLARSETVKRFRLIPKELDHEDGELTATQKVKRAAIAKLFNDLIEEMYAGGAR